ncbi:MAG TPA: TetR/AcrR family transcriptional regulator [Solirubrobacteraceae bacterium]|nr:TetR/AcrR family transcriptional regulator [Solirubrobacteraceae bacterium]
MLMVAESSLLRGGEIEARRSDTERGVGAGQAQLAQIQRARVLTGMFEAVDERGAADVTVADVVARSGVSRRTFYELFEDRDACFLAALDDALAMAAARVVPAYLAQSKWADRVRASLVALLRFLDDEPTIGRLLLCASLSGGRVVSARRNEVVAQLVAVVEQGRRDCRDASALPELTGEGTVGAVLAIVHRNLEGEQRAPLTALANNLMAMIALPYLGVAAAKRELARPLQPPSANEHGAGMLADPFKGAGMRLTYRTIRVLMSVAELGEQGTHPSNRQLGDHADIRDQGQISKLLHRLQRAGLIENNDGTTPAQGTPNAWRLTPAGERLVRGIRAHTVPAT